MENKKLLKYIINDLSELEELVTEKGMNCFDDLELEFMQTRIKGAKKLMEILIEQENKPQIEKKVIPLKDETVEETEKKVEIEVKKEVNEEVVNEEKREVNVKDSQSLEEKKLVEKVDPIVEDESQGNDNSEIIEEPVKNKIDEVNLEDEKVVDEHSQRLGDSFTKEKSVNDLLSADIKNLEHKLSHQSVSNIKSAIGINDRFQYIRELFDGNADNFSKTVTELDSFNSLKEAVEYLQQNFKWKKNETSLKFVSLVKRRFPNE